jgi:hypothetical protein
MNYAKLLQDGYAECKRWDSSRNDGDEMSRYEYLCDNIFQIDTYDSELSNEFGRMAVEVCEAINNGTTFDYIKDDANRRWYTIMCNLPFFADRITWGTSIRGAFWATGYENGDPTMQIVYSSCGLFDGEDQVTDFTFTLEQWHEFIAAVVAFGRGE